jgi:hypothetical protein
MVNDMSSIFTRNAFPLVAGVILVITGVVTGVTVSGHSTELAAQKATIDSLTMEIDEAREIVDALDTEISLKDSGADASRVAADTEVISELLRLALVWDDNASYVDARDATMRAYDLSEDSAFMASFLPVAPVNKDSKGNEYPYIDAAGLNSSVGDFQAKVLSIDAVEYSYMVLVDVQGSSSDGMGKAVNVATVFVTIDGDGAVSEITGFASTTELRASE